MVAIPPGHLWGPLLQVRPYQVAKFTDLLLRVVLGSHVEKMKQCPQAEADDKVLAYVEREQAAGVLFGKAVFFYPA